MKRFKIFIDAQKEEKWLNDLLQKGWQLKNVNAFHVYTFEKTKNPEQIIRIDCQSFKSNEKFSEYKALYEDFGWKHLSGSRFSKLQYWLKANNKDDSLFSDRFSEEQYFIRLSKLYGEIAFLFLFFTLCTYKNASQFVSIKDAYYTPGLWERVGMDFWRGFLFETPFAVVRFFGPWLMLFFGLISINMYFKYKRKANQSIE